MIAGSVLEVRDDARTDQEQPMRSVQLQEAEATLSDLIEAAEQGSPTTITRQGRPAAVLVPVPVAEKIYPAEKPVTKTFAEHLLAYPGGVELVRDHRPPREIDL